MERQELRVGRPRLDVAVIELVGEYDMANAAEIEAAVAGAIGEERGIVFDLSETRYLDSSTIRVVFNTHSALAERGRQLALRIQTASVVMRALEICNLSDAIPTTTDLQDAIRIATDDRPT